MEYPVENKSNGPIYVGGVMIPPGEIRHFKEEDLPPEFKPAAAAPAEEAPPDALLAIVELSVAKLKTGLPDLSLEELERLESLESAGQNRKGVFTAIAEERLRRAELLAAGGDGAGGDGAGGDGAGGDGAGGEGAGGEGAGGEGAGGEGAGGEGAGGEGAGGEGAGGEGAGGEGAGGEGSEA